MLMVALSCAVHNCPQQPSFTPGHESLPLCKMSLRINICCNSSSTNEPYVYAAELTLHYALLPSYSLTCLFLKHIQNA